MRQFDTGKENGGLQRIALWACAAVAVMIYYFVKIRPEYSGMEGE